jgi:hypothetical protein
VFGLLAEATGTSTTFVIKQPAYQFGWSYAESANACLNGLREIDSAKQQWAIGHSTGDDARKLLRKSPLSAYFPFVTVPGVALVATGKDHSQSSDGALAESMTPLAPAPRSV